ncbi:hypothetical protein AVEN_197849-1 [Araneus ventricosus]|uniref:Uncharacterized protein n=1 Tax=Araneus ventricosus TaxID=182803 RepID=A0A4Y2LHV3_ARAVE|nr:hypothetical protein AVEN_197849-1 [Araneus ventricosus]
MDTYPVMEVVQEYSSRFLHVEIEYIHWSKKERLIKSWCRHFTVFLQILTNNSQLISVEFQHLPECFEQIDTTTYTNICRTIIHFLGSQHRLKRVEIRICFFRFNEGVELLRKLTENSRETHLVLRDFIRYELMDKVTSSFQDSLVIRGRPQMMLRLEGREGDREIVRRGARRPGRGGNKKCDIPHFG